MPNNFKLTGDYYVSVDGSDSNSGLTKDLPKRTLQGVINAITAGPKTIVVGAGVYREVITKSVAHFTTFLADGYVVFEGGGLTGSFGIFTGGFDGIEIRNHIIYGSAAAYAISIQNCYIKNCWYYGSGNGGPHINNKWANCNISLSGLACTFDFNLFFNTKIGVTSTIGGTTYNALSVGMFKNSYLDPTSSVIASSTGVTVANFNYNNIQGTIIMNSASTVTTGTYQDVYGKYYNLAITTSTGTGTVGDPYGRPYTSGATFSFSVHRILYPTYNVNSFSSDPIFNSVESQDFTLQVTSPMIAKASDGISNIGGTKYALRYAATGDAFNTSAVSISNLALSANNWTVSGGTTGEVVSAPILISSTAKVLQKITYNGQLEFNKLITGGTAGNRNVPDQEVYAAGTQGANPDRLVYYLRYSTQASQPTADAQWDNGGYWTAGTYNTFEWNTKPSIDTSYVGNGSPTFNSSVTPVYLNVTWIQLKVKLRNDYA